MFDFDGTLADTLRVGLRAYNTIAPALGLRTVADDELGALRRRSTREMLGEFGIPLTKLPRLVQRVRREMNASMHTVELFDGVPDCLGRLHAAGIGVGVVSSNARENIAACLERNRVFDLVEFIHTSTHLFGKQRALRRLLRTRRLAAHEVAYVGDQDRDVVAARACGLQAVAACWGYQSREALACHDPDLLATVPSQIAEYVLGVA